MSLINKMLRDLDARRAPAAERLPLPSAVHAAHRRRPEPNWIPVAVGAGVGAVIAGGAWYWLYGSRAPAPAVAPAVVTQVPVVAQPSAEVPPQLPAAAVAAAPMPAAPAAAPAQGRAVAPSPATAVQPKAAASASLPGQSAQRATVPAATVARPPRPVAATSAQAAPLAPAQAAGAAKAAAAPPAPGAKPAAAAGKAVPVSAVPGSIEKRPHGALANEAAENEYNKAIAALRRGADSEAIAGLHAALRLDASHVSARQALLSLLVRMQRFAEAQTLAAEGLAVVPNQAGWALALARLQAGSGKLTEASETLARHARYAERDADYQAVSAVLMQKQKRFQEAVDFYRAALALRGSESRWWYGLGVSLENVQQPQEARAAFQRAKEIGNLPPDLASGVERHLR